MPWTYQQSTGNLTSPSGSVVERGYSGFGRCKNCPNCQMVEGEGPIPRGIYTIQPSLFSPHTGPLSMHLDPFPDNQMYNRSGFMIHGDSEQHPGSASCGCIVVGHNTRQLIADSSDKTITVIA